MDAIWPILTYWAKCSFLEGKTKSSASSAFRWDDAIIAFITPYLAGHIAACTTRGKEQIDSLLEPVRKPTQALVRNRSLHRAPLPEQVEASAAFLEHSRHWRSYEQQRGRTKQDQHDRGKDKQRNREDHFDRCTVSFLFRHLPPAYTHLIRLDP